MEPRGADEVPKPAPSEAARRWATLYLVVCLVAGLGTFALAFLFGEYRFGSFFVSLADSGRGIQGTLAAHLLAVALCAAVGARSIARGGRSGLALLTPALVPLVVASIGCHLAIDGAAARLDGVPAFMRNIVRTTVLVDALRVLLVGLASSAFLAGIVAVLGCVRALSRPSGRQGRRLVAAVVLSSLLAGATILMAGLRTYPSAWGPAAFAAIAGCAAYACAGLSAFGSPSRTRATDLAVALGAGLLMILSLWLAQRLAGFHDYIEVLCDAAPPFRHDVFMAHGVARAAQADWLALASLGWLAVLGVLLLSRKPSSLLRTASGSGREARLSALALLVALGALGLAVSTLRASAYEALEASVHPLARLESLDPARSRSTGWAPVSIETIVVDQHRVRLAGGRVLGAAADFEASGPDGRALRATVESSVEGWRRRRAAHVEDERPVIARIPIPREEDFAYEGVSLAVDRRVEVGTFMEVLDAVRGGGVFHVGLLVAEDAPRPRSEVLRGQVRRGVVPIGGRHAGWIRAHEASLRNPAWPDHPGNFGLGLVVVASERGLHIAARGGRLPEGCGFREAPSAATIPLSDHVSGCPIADRQSPPECAYDFAALGRCLTRISEEHPEERSVQVGAEPSVSYQVLIRLLDECAAPPHTDSAFWLDAPFRQVWLPDAASRSGLALLPRADQPGT